jgi:hypothetical protein
VKDVLFRFVFKTSKNILGDTLLCICLLVKAIFIFVENLSQQKLMSLRGTGAAAARAGRVFVSQPPVCRWGDTPLKNAISEGKSDVVAYLRSIGAPE